MTLKDRLLQYIRYKNMPIKQFEEKSNLSNGYVSSMRKGLGTEKLENVLNAFPDLNRNWLLYEEGDMLKAETIKETPADSVSMPREVFDQITRLTETVLSQQRTIETLSKKIPDTAVTA